MKKLIIKHWENYNKNGIYFSIGNWFEFKMNPHDEAKNILARFAELKRTSEEDEYMDSGDLLEMVEEMADLIRKEIVD
tara:strand:+ start:61 stop:294 length:234 start_codon:yes stop_codon:yes gene_type:complete